LKESRSNDAIIKAIQECIHSSVTFISAVFLLLPINFALNEEDLQALNIMRTLLGDSFKKTHF